MTLTCPHCGFSREIDPARIPPGPVRVTCPQCREGFEFHPPEREAEEEKNGPEQELEAAFEPAPESPASGAPLSAPSPAETSPEPPHRAGFWIRLVAFLADSVVVSLLEFVFGFLLLRTAALLGSPVDEESFLVIMTLQFLNLVLTLAYFVYFTGYRGQTPGKILLRLQVVRTDGLPLGYGRAFLREVPGKLLSGILLGFGYLMVAFQPKKQGLHDLIADTYVIKLPPTGSQS